MVFRQPAWTASLAVAILVGGMYAATLVAFSILRALPLVAGAVTGAH
jgi:hypothetical protein